jgi:ATP-dependent DNA helicase RecG
LIHLVVLNLLDTPIEFLKGVGPKRAELLRSEIQVFEFRDLLNYFPFRYIDRSRFHKVSEIEDFDSLIQLRGKLRGIEKVGKPRQQRLVAEFYDDSGSIELVWFKGVRFIAPSLKPGVEYVVFGKPNLFKNKLSIAHPELDVVTPEKLKLMTGWQPVYSTTEKLTGKGLNSRGIEKLVKTLLPQVIEQIPETLNADLHDRLKMISRKSAFENIHVPKDQKALEKARFRIKFEELFFTQIRLQRANLQHKKDYRGFVFEQVGQHFNEFYAKHLPFELTNAQKRVMKEIRKDLGSSSHMNRLLQGDVGSGKTIVAVLCALLAIDNGFQACIMAPTEILAQQHFQSISELLEPMGMEVGLLTGSVKQAEREPLHEKLQNGELKIIVGTHALLEDKVKFKNLGIAIIDEQHRFGVAQRAKLWKKNSNPPHVLVMTATPIPRTLAMTFYGDLDTSVIDELPPGRKPIKTVHYFEQSRLKLNGFLKEEIAKGRQVYVVYPLIEESEKLDYADLMEGYESVSRAFPRPDYQVSVVHGRMKSEDKEYEMQRFAKGQTHIMVATTVIEVGVNVPNASVMVIESTEKFGLSQLHQLRGRVGRGAEQSYCILMSGNKLSNDARTRIKTMCATNDGFEIAEVDLNLRGPGDIMGTQQSGLMDFKLASLTADSDLMKLSRAESQYLLKLDPKLENPDNKRISIRYSQLEKERPNWGRIS